MVSQAKQEQRTTGLQYEALSRSTFTINIWTILLEMHQQESFLSTLFWTSSSVGLCLSVGRDGQYGIISDIPRKKLPTMRLGHFAIITINSSWWSLPSLSSNALSQHTAHSSAHPENSPGTCVFCVSKQREERAERHWRQCKVLLLLTPCLLNIC